LLLGNPVLPIVGNGLTTPKKTASLIVGSFGYQRLFGMASTTVGEGGLSLPANSPTTT
jgi:hypothetical protein